MRWGIAFAALVLACTTSASPVPLDVGRDAPPIDAAIASLHLAPACPGAHVIISDRQEVPLIGADVAYGRAPTAAATAERGPIVDDAVPSGVGGFAGIVDPETGDLFWNVLMEVGRIRPNGETVWLTHVPAVEGEYGVALTLDRTAGVLFTRYEAAAGTYVISIDDGTIAELPVPHAGRARAFLPDGRVLLPILHPSSVLTSAWVVADRVGTTTALPIDVDEWPVAVGCDRIFLRRDDSTSSTFSARAFDGALRFETSVQSFDADRTVIGPEGVTFAGNVGIAGMVFVRLTDDGLVRAAPVPELEGVELSHDRAVLRMPDGTVVARFGDVVGTLSPDLVAAPRNVPATITLGAPWLVAAEGRIVVEECQRALDQPAIVHVFDAHTFAIVRSFPAPFGHCAAFAIGPQLSFAVDFAGDRSAAILAAE